MNLTEYGMLFLYVVVGYLIGSIPFGYIIVKLRKGIDVRTVGSGNIGATNVWRVVGWPWGILCFLLDVAKGFIPSVCSIIIAIILGDILFILPVVLLVGISAIIGHLYPIYLRFQGGKGVATSLGVFLVIAPYSTIIALVTWLLFLLMLRYVSLSSIVAAIALSLSSLLLNNHDIRPTELSSIANFCISITCIIASVMVILRHIPNIKRLIKGTEPRVKLWGKGSK